MLRSFFISWVLFSLPLAVFAKSITTNAAVIAEAPEWLKRTRVEKVTDRIQRELEWTIRRVKVHWHNDAKKFEKVHGRGAAVQAFARKSENAIYIGPKVNDKNFDEVFGHELAHVISYQKYKGSIPAWLEEGMANHVAKKDKVDYARLMQQPFLEDVRTLAHPLKQGLAEAEYRYMASQALVEMLEKKCNLRILLQLSVERKMEDYIKTYCEISDLNKAFREWVTKKAPKSSKKF